MNKRFRAKNRSLRFQNRSGRINTTSTLSQFEERKDRQFFIKIGKTAAINAINENKALGIPVTFLDGDTVFEMGNAGKIAIRQLTPSQPRKYSKGTILHVPKRSR